MKKWKVLIHNIYIGLTLFCLFPQLAFAEETGEGAIGSIGSTKLVTGLERLVNDATSAVMLFTIPVTILAVVFFLIRRAAADEQDQKRWGDRAKTAVICGMGAVVAGGVIKALAGYFK